jgi:hypothetical protein
MNTQADVAVAHIRWIDNHGCELHRTREIVEAADMGFINDWLSDMRAPRAKAYCEKYHKQPALESAFSVQERGRQAQARQTCPLWAGEAGRKRDGDASHPRQAEPEERHASPLCERRVILS